MGTTGDRSRIRGLPWVKVSTALKGHPKLGALRRALGSDPRTVEYLLWFWAYVGEYHRDGNIPESEVPDHLEAACLWSGDRGKLVEALVETGWLDRTRRGGGRARYAVHNWRRWSGGTADELDADAERQRRKRAELREVRPEDVHPQRERERETERKKKEEASTPAASLSAPKPSPGDDDPSPPGSGATPPDATAKAPEQPSLPLGPVPAPEQAPPHATKAKPCPPPNGAPALSEFEKALDEAYLKAIGEPYLRTKRTTIRDRARLKELREGGVTDAAILARWRDTLGTRSGFYAVRTLAALAARWGDLAPDRASIDRPTATPEDLVEREGLRLIETAHASGAASVELPEPPNEDVQELWGERCLLRRVRPEGTPEEDWPKHLDVYAAQQAAAAAERAAKAKALKDAAVGRVVGLGAARKWLNSAPPTNGAGNPVEGEEPL